MSDNQETGPQSIEEIVDTQFSEHEEATEPVEEEPHEATEELEVLSRLLISAIATFKLSISSLGLLAFINKPRPLNAACCKSSSLAPSSNWEGVVQGGVAVADLWSFGVVMPLPVRPNATP